MSYIECKNKNEYRFNGNIFIKDIKSCQCSGVTGNKYTLECKIIERGKHDYSYMPGEDFISKDGNKKLWLDANAKAKIETSIKTFEEKVAEAKQTYVKATIPNYGITILYRRNIMRNYDFIILHERSYNDYKIQLKMNRNLEWMIKDICSDLYIYEKNESKGTAIEALFKSDKNTIQNNPLYISAVNNNDEFLQKQLRLYYRIANDEDCSWIAKFLGLRVLPSLPEEFNNMYIVDSDTIDSSLLLRSGYKILHRPYFAMMKSTHEKWQLNPHDKSGVDAALKDTESMSFTEYLELFDEQDIVVDPPRSGIVPKAM